MEQQNPKYPTSAEGIEKYLGSGLIQIIGPVFASRLISAFGEAIFDIIDDEPGRLSGVEGIGAERVARITASWAALGIPKTAMIRARAGIVLALMEAIADGHCGLLQDQLLARVEQLLEIPGETLADAQAQELAAGLWWPTNRRSGSEYPAVVIPFSVQLRIAAAQSRLHGYHAWQETGCPAR